MRKHGASKRKTWRKLHIGIAIHIQEIVCIALTSNAEDDAVTAAKMLKGKINSFTGDRGYDDLAFREILGKKV